MGLVKKEKKRKRGIYTAMRSVGVGVWGGGEVDRIVREKEVVILIKDQKTRRESKEN